MWLGLCQSAHCDILRAKLGDIEQPLVVKGGVTWSQWGERALNRRSLHGNPFRLVLDRREKESGIFVEKGAIIHPTAKLVAPCHIGAKTYVGAGSTVGPMAVLGADVIVSYDTSISHSLVRSASVLLEHHVHRNSMINPHSAMNPSGVLNLRNHSLIHQLAASVGRIVAMVGCL